MPISSKFQRLAVEPVVARVANTETKNNQQDTQIASNTSALAQLTEGIATINAAGYQTEAQVDSAIQEVVGAAPAALDTLKEIADALADDDNAIAALVAQDTANSTAITQLQTEINALESSQRIKLTAETTYYVNIATGADINDGLTAGTPFASISKALSVLEKDLDLNGFRVIIAIAGGDYSGEGILHLPTLANPDPDTCSVSAFELSSPVILRGDAFSYPIVEGIDLDHSAHYGLESLTIKDRLRAIRNGIIDTSNLQFFTPTDNSIEAIDGGIINAIGFYFFEGTYGRTNQVFYVDGGTISVLPVNGSSLTLDFTQSFAIQGTAFYVENNGVLDLKNNVGIRNLYQHVLVFGIQNAYAYYSSPSINFIVFGDWGNYNGVLYGANQLHESIQRITVSADFSLDNYPAKFVHAVVTADCVGSLPTDPLVGRHLVIKNSTTSTATLTVNSVAIAPSEFYDIKWDGTEWSEW